MIRFRKARVRSSFGSPKIWSGGPSSWTTPLVEEAHLRGHFAGEAHLVGGEQHGHALPGEVAHDVEDLGDELGIERRGDLVEQQHLRAPWPAPATMATRCCWPPDRRSGYSIALASRPMRFSSTMARAPRPRCRFRPSTLIGAKRHVLDHAHVREEVEALEHDADVAPQPVEIDAGPGDAVVHAGGFRRPGSFPVR